MGIEMLVTAMMSPEEPSKSALTTLKSGRIEGDHPAGGAQSKILSHVI